jgi:hypothetical protein
MRVQRTRSSPSASRSPLTRRHNNKIEATGDKLSVFFSIIFPLRLMHFVMRKVTE